jgi:hypothetical protein
MTGTHVDILWFFAAIAGLGVLYVIIRDAVYQALKQFLREASRLPETREAFEIPRRVDRLAEHLAKIIKRLPPDQPPQSTDGHE